VAQVIRLSGGGVELSFGDSDTPLPPDPPETTAHPQFMVAAVGARPTDQILVRYKVNGRENRLRLVRVGSARKSDGQPMTLLGGEIMGLRSGSEVAYAIVFERMTPQGVFQLPGGQESPSYPYRFVFAADSPAATGLPMPKSASGSEAASATPGLTSNGAPQIPRGKPGRSASNPRISIDPAMATNAALTLVPSTSTRVTPQSSKEPAVAARSSMAQPSTATAALAANDAQLLKTELLQSSKKNGAKAEPLYPSAPDAFVSRQAVSPGSVGPEVGRLHLVLGELGHVIMIEEVERCCFAASTAEALRTFQQRSGLATTAICDQESWRLLELAVETERCAPPTHPPERLVHGRVRDACGHPVPGAVVTAFDKALRHEQELGRTETDAHGLYRLSYSVAQIHSIGNGRANLIVRAFCGDQLIAVSPVMFDAPRVAVINLNPGDSPYPGPSEFEKIAEAISPVLDSVLPADLQPADITFLWRDMNLEPEHIRLFAAAAALARDTDVPAPAFYGMFRLGLPTDLTALLTLKPAARVTALTQAVTENLIPLEVGAQVDSIEAKLGRLVVTEAYREPPAGARPSVGAVLATSVVPRSVQETFLSAFAARTSSLPKFWSDLAANPLVGPQHVSDLQFTYQATALARNHLPMIEALQRLRRNGQALTLRDLAKLDDADWQQLVAQSGVPVDTPGSTDAEKAARYVRALSRTIARAFPTAVLAAHIDREADSKNADLRTFFAKHPDFELADGHVELYLEEHPGALGDIRDPAALQAHLKQIQRVFNLTPEHTEIKVLLNDKLDSAQATVKIGREAFIARYAAALGTDRGAAIFDRAQQIAATALLMFGRFSPRLNGVGPNVTTRIGG